MTAGVVAPSRPDVAALALVRDPAGRVLLILRRKPPYRGWWSLPGGALEFGESIAGAAIREVREESGLEATFLRLAAWLNIRIVAGGEGAVGGHFVGALCELAAAGVPVASDEGPVRWFAPDELLDPAAWVLPPGDAEAIRTIAANPGAISHLEIVVEAAPVVDGREPVRLLTVEGA